MAITVAALLALSACGSSDDSEGDRAPASARATVEVAAPSTTEDSTSREALVREADLAQLQAFAAACPEKHSDMQRHYEESGEVMDCGQFGDLMLAVTVAMEEEAQLERQREYEAAIKEALEEEARREREYVAAVKVELARQAALEDRERRQREYEEAVKRAIRAEHDEAHQQGQALVDRMCGSQGGAYLYYISPVRVWLDYCNSGGGWNSSGGGEGGDRDCEDFGYEFRIDPNNDPHGLDGDGDGIACEGW